MRVVDLLHIDFDTIELSLTPIIAGLCLQLHLGGLKKDIYASLLDARTTFKTVVCFHIIAFVEITKENQWSSNSDEAPAGVQVSYKAEMLIGLVVHLVAKAWEQVLRLEHFGDWKRCDTP